MGRRRRRRPDPADAARALPEAIAALSRALPAAPSPETFRRAKFDRPEAAPALWRLLFRVLSPLPADGASASLALEAQARWVKSALRSQGYPRQALVQLPDEGFQGGRELLLALAWLLARGPLPERLLTQSRVRLGDEMPLCECEALASPGLPAPSVEAEGCVDIRHLQWLMGKLRLRWRNLMAGQQEQCALLGQIHAYTRGCHSDRSLGHLSVTETELLRDPEGGRQLLLQLETENARLEAALEWRRRELVFWQWMVRRHAPTHCLSCPSPALPCYGSPGTWTQSWTPAPQRPHCQRFCPGSPNWGLERRGCWCGSCRPCRRSCGPCRRSCRRRWRPGGPPGRLRLVATGPSGEPRGGPCRRPWRRTWQPCRGPGSRTRAGPGPTGPAGW
ncbi:tubulin epsilon and delta complex protein 1 isoform X2 [Moschus berezovskii]|uniref:tubulin epsilon and delta complex protein 1 isoform X2 n=1 Tax=Moschus berezovskii TaxID=68408 RepID=UPI002443CBFF|nr:tubulin epsilon and delta complex protein 1 isoform X2 [Moschus berezovskii]